MNKAVIPAICFVAGTVCGVIFIPRGGDGGPGSSDGGGSGAAAAGLVAGRGDAAKSEGRKSGRPAGGREGAPNSELTELLDLCGGFNQAGGMLALYRRIEHLDANALRQLAAEVELVPVTDHRQWQVRSTVLQRYAEVDPDGALDYARSIGRDNIKQMAIGAVLGQIANQDMSRAIGIARGFEDPVDFQAAVNALAMANTKGSPAELLELVRERGGVRMDWTYRQMFDNWARNDPQAAISNLVGIPPGNARNHALQGIASGMIQTSPEAGLEWVSGLGNLQERTQVMSTLIGTLAAADPARALTVLDGLGSATQRQQLLGTVASQWASADPAAARSWIESLPAQDRITAMQGSMYQLASDPQWSVAQLAKLPASSRVAELSGNLANCWAQRDPAAAAEWVRTLPQGTIRQGARQNLVQQWAETDPVAAAEFLSGETLGRNESYLAGQVAGRLIMADPGAAVAWMDKLDVNEDGRSSMISSAVSSWAQHDAASAANYVLQLEGKVRENAIQSLMSGWGNQDLEGALAWTRDLGDSKERNAALGSLISNISHQSPDRAAAVFDEAARGDVADDGNNPLKSSAHNIAGSWARVDPVKAAQWAVDLPESMDRAGALGAVVGTWAESAPVEAAEWVGEFGPGPDRDGAVGGLVSKIVDQDPEAAFLWAVTIDNPSSQGTYVRQSVGKWSESDPDAARAAVESAHLSDEVRQRALEHLKDR